MKKMLVVIALTIITTSSAFADRVLLKCTVSEVVDSNVFEESLSVEEYPLVELTQGEYGKVAKIGSSVYSEENDDRFIVGLSVGFDKKYIILSADADDADPAYIISVNGTSKLGLITVADKIVAKLQCQ